MDKRLAFHPKEFSLVWDAIEPCAVCGQTDRIIWDRVSQHWYCGHCRAEWIEGTGTCQPNLPSKRD